MIELSQPCFCHTFLGTSASVCNDAVFCHYWACFDILPSLGNHSVPKPRSTKDKAIDKLSSVTATTRVELREDKLPRNHFSNIVKEAQHRQVYVSRYIDYLKEDLASTLHRIKARELSLTHEFHQSENSFVNSDKLPPLKNSTSPSKRERMNSKYHMVTTTEPLSPLMVRRL
ncbi:hypothetical protein RCL1_004873 [Eukaryota sp. TZLM3-RCL]